MEQKLEELDSKWQQTKKLLEKKYQIEAEKRKLKNKYQQLTTTKLLILFLFITCTVIEIFTGAITIYALQLSVVTGIAADLTPLVTLIGAVVSEVIGFAIYAIKSAKENSVNGVTYLKAQYELQQQEDEIE